MEVSSNLTKLGLNKSHTYIRQSLPDHFHQQGLIECLPPSDKMKKKPQKNPKKTTPTPPKYPKQQNTQPKAQPKQKNFKQKHIAVCWTVVTIYTYLVILPQTDFWR